MKVNINSKTTETQSANLKQLAEELRLDPKGVAVAMNNKIVPRANWEDTLLVEGADIVIVKAFCGG